MAYLGGKVALAVECELRGQEGVLEARSRCPALHSNRDCSRQMALVMGILKAKHIKVKRYYSTQIWRGREGALGGRDLIPPCQPCQL